MELPIGMETVASFNQIFGVAAFGYLSFQDLHSWELVVDHIEIFELCAVIDDLLVYFR